MSTKPGVALAWHGRYMIDMTNGNHFYTIHPLPRHRPLHTCMAIRTRSTYISRKTSKEADKEIDQSCSPINRLLDMERMYIEHSDSTFPGKETVQDFIGS